MDISQHVARLFLRDLGRQADPAGQAFWESRAKEVSPAQLNVEFRQAAKQENPQAGQVRGSGMATDPYSTIALPGEEGYRPDKSTNFFQQLAPFIIPIIGAVAPQLLPAIGKALGATGLAAQAVGAGVVNAGVTAATGGSASDILKAGLAAGAGTYAGGVAGQSVQSAQQAGTLSGTLGGNASLPAIAGSSVGAGTGALIQTGDLGQAGIAAVGAGLGQAVGGTVLDALPDDANVTLKSGLASAAGGAAEAAATGQDVGPSALVSGLAGAGQDYFEAQKAKDAQLAQLISAFESERSPGVGTQYGPALAGISMSITDEFGNPKIILDATPEEIASAPVDASFFTVNNDDISYLSREQALGVDKPASAVDTKALFGLGTPDPSSPYAAAFGGSTGALNPGWYAVLAVDADVPPAQVIEQLEMFKTPENKNIIDEAIKKVKDIEIQAVINKTTPQEIVRNVYTENLNNAKNVVEEANKAINLAAGGAVEGATGVSGDAGGSLEPIKTLPSSTSSPTASGATSETSLISPVVPKVPNNEIVINQGTGISAGRTDSIEKQIRDFYTNILGREADVKGQDFWTKRALTVGVDQAKKEFEKAAQTELSTRNVSEGGGSGQPGTNTGASTGDGTGASVGLGTGSGDIGEGSGSGNSGYGPGAGGTGDGTGTGDGDGPGEGGGEDGGEDTGIETDIDISSTPIKIIKKKKKKFKRRGTVETNTVPLATLLGTPLTMMPGSSALAQALSVGDAGGSYMDKKGQRRQPVWNVESLKLSDELGGSGYD